MRFFKYLFFLNILLFSTYSFSYEYSILYYNTWRSTPELACNVDGAHFTNPRSDPNWPEYVGSCSNGRNIVRNSTCSPTVSTKPISVPGWTNWTTEQVDAYSNSIANVTVCSEGCRYKDPMMSGSTGSDMMNLVLGSPVPDSSCPASTAQPDTPPPNNTPTKPPVQCSGDYCAQPQGNSCPAGYATQSFNNQNYCVKNGSPPLSPSNPPSSSGNGFDAQGIINAINNAATSIQNSLSTGFTSVTNALGITNQKLDAANAKLDTGNGHLNDIKNNTNATNQKLDATNGKLDALNNAATSIQNALSTGFTSVTNALSTGFTSVTNALGITNQKLDAANAKLDTGNGHLNDIKNNTNATNQKLDATNGKLDAANAKLDTGNGHLNDIKNNTNATNQKLDATNGKLDATNAKLDTGNGHLNDIKNNTNATNQKLDATNGKLDEINQNGKDGNGLLQQIKDFFTEEHELPTDSTTVPYSDIDLPDYEQDYVSWTATCPPDVHVPINLMGQSSTLNLSWSPICELLSKLRWAIIACAYFAAAYIILGMR